MKVAMGETSKTDEIDRKSHGAARFTTLPPSVTFCVFHYAFKGFTLATTQMELFRSNENRLICC